MSKHIGFIGLGNMGRGMCRNLIRAGHTLTVFDTSEAAAEAFRGRTATSFFSRYPIPTLWSRW